MSRYVLDASVALRWLLSEETHPNAEGVLERLVVEPERFAVPELFAYEVLAALFRLHPKPLDAYRSAVLPILQGGLLRYPMTEAIAERAFLFRRSGLTGYDACYAALAEELEALWLTFDARAHERIQASGRSVNLAEGLPADWDSAS